MYVQFPSCWQGSHASMNLSTEVPEMRNVLAVGRVRTKHILHEYVGRTELYAKDALDISHVLLPPPVP